MKKYSETAFNVVNHLLKINKNNVISISAELHNNNESPMIEMPLLEEIALAIRKKKAFPFLEVSTENLKKRFLSEMPEEIFSHQPKYYNKWIDDIDGFIEIGWKAIAGDFNNDNDVQLQQLKRTTNKIWEKILKHNKNFLFLNFPSPELAEYLRLDYETLCDIYLKAINCNYSSLKIKASELMEKYLQHSSYSLITSNQQTSETLMLELEDKSPMIYNGDPNRQLITIIPTGKIEWHLERRKMHGTFIAEQVYYNNKIYKNVKINFQSGLIRFVNFKSETKENFLLQNAIMNSKEDCILEMGFNPEIKKRTNYYFYDNCINNNISIKLIDAKNNTIVLSNLNTIIENNI